MAVTVDGDGAITGLTNNIREQFFYPCNGEQITTASGDSLTFSNVTAAQAGTTTFTDLTGSSISYTPPSGTKTVIYEFQFAHTKESGEAYTISHFKFFIDSDEVTKAYHNVGSEQPHGEVIFRWPIRIGGTADTTSGRVSSWTSNKTLKLQYREYSGSRESVCHQTSLTDGGSSDTFVLPRIGITALTS
tara:strand:- start:44 stop:610 length:567 start_codon:yes stop_codon:yes gene_type:complete